MEEKGKEEHKACAAMPIVSAIQECMLLGVAEERNGGLILKTGLWCKAEPDAPTLLHLPVILPLTHQRLPTSSLKHMLGILEFFT